ncbi:MAG: phosphopentomutase [bacterium]|nr:MAG: phosphopentomutase [bacterium]
MKTLNRSIIIILDGVGIGELPDAALFQDTGSHTLGNLARAVGGLHLPRLEKLGLGNIDSIMGLKPQKSPQANYGKMREQSPGKDSTSGHWEIAGHVLDFAFPTYPEGFPPEVLEPFKKRIQRDILGNIPASGTEIIKELGEEHVRTGKPIIYTSADSVFQIAAHEEVIPLPDLYEMCQIARDILTGEHAVSRVIARPFIGKNSQDFTRTRARRDFSLKPSGKLLQNCFQEARLPTVGIGKIDDLYAGVGLDHKLHSKSNREGIDILLQQIKMLEKGLIMINLVDFDMLWGHRNNPAGFYQELQEFDRRLESILHLLQPGDLLFITADHGNDPTTPSTDHSREYVPLLVYGPNLARGINLGIRETFADLGATVAEAFGLSECHLKGCSFWPEVAIG